jgi:GNAT superfamily N-acetyltransferase
MSKEKSLERTAARARSAEFVRERHTRALSTTDRTALVGASSEPRTRFRGKHLKVYRAGLAVLPDWRITCFFVDKDYRGKGVASAALAGALQEISRLGGGTVESYPEDVANRAVSASFLYNSRLGMFERQGFQRMRQLGKNHWVVAKLVTSTNS